MKKSELCPENHGLIRVFCGEPDYLDFLTLEENGFNLTLKELLKKHGFVQAAIKVMYIAPQEVIIYQIDARGNGLIWPKPLRLPHNYAKILLS